MKQVQRWQRFVSRGMLAAVFFLSAPSSWSSETTPALWTRAVVLQQRVQHNGVLIAGPCPSAEALYELVQQQQFFSLESYVAWLQRNVSYTADGERDEWASPKQTLRRGSGDCEDLAFLNAAALRVMGFEAEVWAILRGRRNHAVCVFKEGDTYSIFDNRQLRRTTMSCRREVARHLLTAAKAVTIQEIDHKDGFGIVVARR